MTARNYWSKRRLLAATRLNPRGREEVFEEGRPVMRRKDFAADKAVDVGLVRCFGVLDLHNLIGRRIEDSKNS